jgi:hypothetical protein
VVVRSLLRLLNCAEVRVPLFHPSNSLQAQNDCAGALIGVYQKHGHLEFQFEAWCHHCGWSHLQRPFVKSRCHVLAGHSRVLKLFIAMCHFLSQAFPKPPPPPQSRILVFLSDSQVVYFAIALHCVSFITTFFFPLTDFSQCPHPPITTQQWPFTFPKQRTHAL